MLRLIVLSTVSSNLLREDTKRQLRVADDAKIIGLDKQDTKERPQDSLNQMAVTSQGEPIPMKAPGILRVSPPGGTPRNVMAHDEGSLIETLVGDPVPPPVVLQPQPSAVGAAPQQPAPIVAAPPQPAPIVAAPPQPAPIVAAPQQPAPIVAAPPPLAPIVAAPPPLAPIVAAPPPSPSVVPAPGGQSAEAMSWWFWLLMVMGIVVLIIAGYYVYWKYSRSARSVTAFLGDYGIFAATAQTTPEDQADYHRTQMQPRTISHALSTYSMAHLSGQEESAEGPGYAAMRKPTSQDSIGREDARPLGSESERSGGADRSTSDRMERRKSYGERRRHPRDDEPERGNSKDRTRDVLRSPRQRTPRDDKDANPIDFANLPPSRRTGGKRGDGEVDF
eukprot:GEMP01021085.1.p1 GENE.GEMP01021085.1~~GEMP01021085.1.p1  ORF type:complete len:391 (+),score=116.05 GEMP01021085.1:405-1577(+)